MLLRVKDKIFTDNTKEYKDGYIFVKTKLNEKYHTNEEYINDIDLKKFVDISGIKIIGITGTNGKTTTAGAIYSILLDLGYNVALLGTRGFFINEDKIKPYTLTTPSLLELYEDILLAKEYGCDFFVTEVSSHAISQNRICGIDFELKVLTNISSDHLDYHKSIEEYISVKNSFFSDTTKKLINKDEKKAKYNIKNGFAYGIDNPATYSVKAYSFKSDMFVMFDYFGKSYNFSSPLVGIFNIYNLLCAVASVHIVTNRNLEEITAMVENFGGISGRMEVVSKEPFVIVDFAHTPDAFKSVFESFNGYDIICVFGAGGNRDKLKRPLMGKIANLYCSEIILTSDNVRFEDPDEIINDIKKGIKKEVKVILNRKEAIKEAINLSKKYKNPVVLILGKGDEEYQIIYDKKLPFNDKKAILEILNG